MQGAAVGKKGSPIPTVCSKNPPKGVFVPEPFFGANALPLSYRPVPHLRFPQNSFSRHPFLYPLLAVYTPPHKVLMSVPGSHLPPIPLASPNNKAEQRKGKDF